jgi:monoamine oxidase
VSARWLAAGAQEDEGSQRQHRVVAGFGALVRWLTGALDRGRVVLRLNTIATLARPVDGTLYFAGEATEAEETGTVQAALASGQRVARQMMRSRRERR